MDPYDVALSKLGRNYDCDYDDVMHLARTIPFDLEVFESRYETELRPTFIGNVKEAHFSFHSWLEDIREERARIGDQRSDGHR